jgi:hypothetical protein
MSAHVAPFLGMFQVKRGKATRNYLAFGSGSAFACQYRLNAVRKSAFLYKQDAREGADEEEETDERRQKLRGRAASKKEAGFREKARDSTTRPRLGVIVVCTLRETAHMTRGNIKPNDAFPQSRSSCNASILQLVNPKGGQPRNIKPGTSAQT